MDWLQPSRPMEPTAHSSLVHPVTAKNCTHINYTCIVVRCYQSFENILINVVFLYFSSRIKPETIWSMCPPWPLMCLWLHVYIQGIVTDFTTNYFLWWETAELTFKGTRCEAVNWMKLGLTVCSFNSTIQIFLMKTIPDAEENSVPCNQ